MYGSLQLGPHFPEPDLPHFCSVSSGKWCIAGHEWVTDSDSATFEHEKTMKETIQETLAFETLITILSSQTLNTWHLCNLIIKSDTGQHSQLLRCLHNQCAPSYFFDQSSISMLVVAAPTLTAAWPSPRSFTSCKVLFFWGWFELFLWNLNVDILRTL